MRYIIILSFVSLFMVGCSTEEEERGLTIAEHVEIKDQLIEEAPEEEETEETEAETTEEVVEEEPEEETVEEEEEEQEPEGPQPNQNLFDQADVEQGVWMGYEGQIMTNNSDMVLSGPIEYDPSLSFAINDSAYISYYNGETFIETVRYSDVGTELLIEPRQNANNIRVSIPSGRASTFEIYRK